MLKNDYLLAKIGADTAENEPRKESDVAVAPERCRECGEDARDVSCAGLNKTFFAG